MLDTLHETIVAQKIKLFKNASFLGIWLMLLYVSPARSQCGALVWADEFNGTSLNTNNWVYSLGNGCGGASGCGFGNGEREYYTTKNVAVTGGNLVISAMYEPDYLHSGSNYTSGKIGTNGKFSWKYGRMEARIQAPSASAIWPAFWMLADNGNWPRTGEIDIMETQNANPNIANQTLHYFCTPCNNAQSSGVAVNNANWSSAFHIFAVDWSPQKVVYSIDNIITKTYTPSSIGSTGAQTSDWPFDAQNFYLIFNLAVGGSYTGNAVPNAADYPKSMLVDYVRVYTNAASYAIVGDEVSFVGDTKIYSVTDAGAGALYKWSMPVGASVLSGQGTRTITVKFVGVASGNAVANVAPAGCAGADVVLPVKAINNTCALIMDDYESNRNLFRMTANGTFNAPVPNPGQGGSNASAASASYRRNGNNQYDILGFSKFAVGNPDDFRAGIRQFTMDVRTAAPLGTPITIEFGNTALLGQSFPKGRHSQYTAKTGAPNIWNRLTFVFLGSPDLSLSGADVDKIQILFNPNSYSTDEYYIDNFMAQGQAPNTTAINGPAAVCPNQQAVRYSVSGSPNSTYAWTVSGNAIIASGQGTNSILLNYGSAGETISVTETNAAMCNGMIRTATTSVGGACTLGVNFSASPLSTCTGNLITFSDLTTNKSGNETYSWIFGDHASPATSTAQNPGPVSYSAGGLKTVSLTVTNSAGPVTKTKMDYINIAPEPSTCIFVDDYSAPAVTWVSPTNSAYKHSQNNNVWSISGTGNPEWETFNYTLNNGTVAKPLNFSCAANVPILKITAKASENALLRVSMMDVNGKSSDNWPGIDLELTTAVQTYTINFSNHFKNYNGTSPGALDSASIDRLQFYINPGFATFPVKGKAQIYNTSFTGTVKIDWIGIGNNCTAPIPTGVAMTDETDGYKSVPNPFKEESVLRFSTLLNQKLSLRVSDMKGVSVFVKEASTNENIAFGKELNPGIYIVQAQYGNSLRTFRIVKLE